MSKNLHHVLAYLGTIPFIAAAIFFAFDLDFISPITVENIIKSYILAIVSFMAGVNWGQYLNAAKKPPLNLFITSNVITLFNF
jgi:NADH:ubiquinone oxidoreductase subunit 6 (subunit J)